MDTNTKKLLKDFRYLNPGIFRYRRKRLIKLLAKIAAFDLIFVFFAIQATRPRIISVGVFSLLFSDIGKIFLAVMLVFISANPASINLVSTEIITDISVVAKAILR